MTGKSALDLLAAQWTALLAAGMERLFGPIVRRPVFGTVSWADIGALLCFVLFVLLMNGLAAGFVRRRIRQAERHPEAKEWLPRLWRTIGQPLYLLIWIYGIYLAATPILVKLSAPGEVNPVRQFFDKLFDLGVFVVVVWLSFRLTGVVEARLALWARRTHSRLDDLLAPLLGRTLRVIVPVVGLILGLPVIGLPAAYEAVVTKVSSVLIIGAVAWVLFQGVGLIEKAVLAEFDITAADNLQARKVYTQVHVLSKTLYVLIGIFTAASVLMLFDEVRRFGTSILASAGVVGVIVGFAAQRTIANLFAGFQLAMTQPIRIDDVVIVENEWGRIEEITLTYVVVKIWDERRLIVPLSYFIEKPFQNWTRVSAGILGSVFIWADFTAPISQLRPAIQKIVEASPNWDRRFWNLQVTDTTDRAMQLRVLATSADASKSWDLRCEIREKLLLFLQEHHPQGLPRLRATLESPAPLTALHSLKD
jgi:small-conductance mechanosensitive channel